MFDRGEFCCKLVSKMLEEYGVDPRVISAGRPQSNGQAERYVGIIKGKILAMMSETSETLPDNWDETLFHRALQAVRSDPHTGSGYAPGQILLGRPLVYPIEISKMDIDFEGTEFTKPLVEKQKQIHDDLFGDHAEKLEKWQEKYASDYDKRHVKKGKASMKLRKGMLVQYRKHKTKLAKGHSGMKWFPRDRGHKIHSISHQKRVAFLRDIKTGKVLDLSHPFERLRKFQG